MLDSLEAQRRTQLFQGDAKDVHDRTPVLLTCSPRHHLQEAGPAQALAMTIYNNSLPAGSTPCLGPFRDSGMLLEWRKDQGKAVHS